MIRSIISIVICISFCKNAAAQLPVVSSGTIQRFEHFTSKFVDTRKIDVWLPDGYSPKKKYAVLYMHDGNSLYDSSIMWNH